MKKYWVSWVHKEGDGAFELHSPWWISGYDSNDNPMICAAIKTDMIPEHHIRLSYDNPPEDIAFRFAEERPEKWSPFCDRFAKADWMKWDDEPVIKEMGDKTIKVGDTVKMQYPPKYNYGWVSIKERMPEIGKQVLFSNSQYIDVGYRSENDELYCMGAHMTKSMPTHWMFLPEVPQ